MVFFNLLSYQSDVQNWDLDCVPHVQLGITATITVYLTKFQILNIDKF